MKKKSVYALLTCTMLACSACGQQSGTSEGETITEENNSEESNFGENLTENTESTNDTAEETEPTTEISEDNNTENIGNTAAAATDIPITVEMKTEAESETAEDGTILYTSNASYPVVTIEGNEAASEKINADIQARIDSFHASSEILNYAKEDYQTFLADDTGFMGYSEYLGFGLIRSDSSVISFVATYSSYTGGPHGNYGSIGINYNTQTGELISFSDLGEDADSFYADTLDYNLALAETDVYQEMMYPSDYGFSEDIETVLYADDKWYLSTTGLTFISDPYMLGSYAAGTIEFVIPYRDLEEMGLKEEYRYHGNLIQKLSTGNEIVLDINGDGQDDTIHFYSEYNEKEDGTFESIVHFIINGTDFAQSGDTEQNQRFADYAWQDYALYDLDSSDSTIEIAFLPVEYIEENDSNGTYVTYCYFYRYHQDGTLSYLGRFSGDCTDPMATVFEADLQK